MVQVLSNSIAYCYLRILFLLIGRASLVQLVDPTRIVPVNVTTVASKH